TRFSRDWSSDVCSSDLFGMRFSLLYQIATTLLSKRRNVDDDALAIVHRIEAKVSNHNRFLDRLKHVFFPWRKGDGTRIGRVDVRDRTSVVWGEGAGHAS